MSDKINILFLGGAKRVSLAELFIQSGKKVAKEVCIFSYELDPFVPIGAIGKVVVGLKWDNKNILKHLAQTIKENNIHIVLPFVDGATTITARLKNISKSTFIPVSNESICEIMFDKVKANEWFLQNKITTPSNDIKFPLIAKPRNGSASKGLIIIRTDADWNSFKSNHNENHFLIQNYLTADEYTVDIYISEKGEILSVVPRKRMEVTSGESTKSITIKDNEIIEQSKHILSLIELRGPITIQFLRDQETKKLYIMEINPRYGGGVITSIKAGADSTMMILNEYLNKPLKVIDNWEENLIMTRAFREFFYHANNN